MLRFRTTSLAMLALLPLGGCTSTFQALDEADGGRVDGDAAMGEPDSGAVPPDARSVLPDASMPIDTMCEVDLATRTLQCVRSLDPDPGVADDESRTTLRMTFMPGAFDGATRTIDATTDHVLTELSFDGEMFDASMTSGLTANAAHDSFAETVLVWRRVHVLHFDEYARVEVMGEVTIDASGHGHVELTWTAPDSPTGRAGGAGSIDATF